MSHSLKNVKLNDFRRFLLHHDLKISERLEGMKYGAERILQDRLLFNRMLTRFPFSL
jgi:hypothetical protein